MTPNRNLTLATVLLTAAVFGLNWLAPLGWPNIVSYVLVIWLVAFVLWMKRSLDERQREASEQLKAGEARLRAIMESALDCILIMDAEGKITEFNRAAQKAFGYEREEVIGREMAELLMPPPSRERHRKNLNRYRTEGEEGSRLGKRLEQALMRKDGTEFIAEVAMQPVSMQGRPIFAVFLRDVTAQRKAEQALRDSEALYHSLVETLPLCVVRKDADGRFTFANKAFCDFSRKSLKELIGKTDFDLYPSALAKKYRDDDLRVLTTGKLFEDVESHQEADGEIRFVEVLKTPVKDAAGNRIGTQLFFWDVTDRHRAAEQRQKFAAELEERNAKLRTSEEEIRHRNRDLETLLYVISHDLREPLRAIDNFSKLIHDRHAGGLDDAAKDFLQRVIRGAKRMDQLLDDVMTLLKAQRTIKPSENIPASEMVADVLRQLDAKIQETHADVHIADDLPHLHVDRPWANQAVYNLVNNALKFTKTGEHPQIEIGAYHPSDSSATGLVVRDRGPGVHPEHVERIFELFQRDVGRDVEGTGAGLAIVRRVAERHGGKAWVQPRPGGGSEFFITFAN